MMTENQIIQKIKSKNSIDATYSEVIDAKFVNIRGDKKCHCCGRTLKSGSRALTASHMQDKKLNISGRFAVSSNYGNKLARYVKVRHWLCMECACTRANEKLTIHRKSKFNDRKLSYEEQLELLHYEYENGNISAKEYDDTSNAIISQQALEDAVGIGQW